MLIFIYKEFENLSVEKKTFSTALGFEPRSFDCRSTSLPQSYTLNVFQISKISYSLKDSNSLL